MLIASHSQILPSLLYSFNSSHVHDQQADRYNALRVSSAQIQYPRHSCLGWTGRRTARTVLLIKANRVSHPVIIDLASLIHSDGGLIDLFLRLKIFLLILRRLDDSFFPFFFALFEQTFQKVCVYIEAQLVHQRSFLHRKVDSIDQIEV